MKSSARCGVLVSRAALVWPVATRSSLINLYLTPVQGRFIQTFDCGIGFRIVVHFDKAKTLCPPGFPIDYQVTARHRAELFKSASQLVFGQVIRKISYVKIHAMVFL